MLINQKVFSSPSLGNVKFSYTDSNFYKKIKKPKNKSYTISDYKEIFKNYYKNKTIENTKDSHHEINNYYLRCQDNVKNYFMDDKNQFGLKIEGNKKLENCSINIFNDIFNKACSAREQILQNQILNYYYPKDNTGKLMGEKMKLTPIPSKKFCFMKNKNEKDEYLKAKRSAVCMRRLEYTHGLKKNKSQDFSRSYYNNKNINNNFLAILKGAVLIIEDWWLKILNKRFFIDNDNNFIEEIVKDSTNSIEQKILENLNNNNESKNSNNFIDNYLTKQTNRIIEKNERNNNIDYNFNFANKNNKKIINSKSQKKTNKNSPIILKNKNNSSILFKSNRRYAKDANNNKDKFDIKQKKNNKNPIKIIQNSNIIPQDQDYNSKIQTNITPSNYLQNYFKDYCLNEKALYNTCSHKNLKSFEYIQNKYKKNNKQQYNNLTSSENNIDFIINSDEIVNQEGENNSKIILRNKNKKSNRSALNRRRDENKNNLKKDISSDIEPVYQDDMINIMNDNNNNSNNDINNNININELEKKNSKYNIKYNIIKYKSEEFNMNNSERSSMDGSIDEIISKKLKEIHEHNQKYTQRILKAYNQVKFMKKYTIGKVPIAKRGQINNFRSAQFIGENNLLNNNY